MKSIKQITKRVAAELVTTAVSENRRQKLFCSANLNCSIVFANHNCHWRLFFISLISLASLLVTGRFQLFSYFIYRNQVPREFLGYYLIQLPYSWKITKPSINHKTTVILCFTGDIHTIDPGIPPGLQLSSSGIWKRKAKCKDWSPNLGDFHSCGITRFGIFFKTSISDTASFKADFYHL